MENSMALQARYSSMSLCSTPPMWSSEKLVNTPAAKGRPCTRWSFRPTELTSITTYWQPMSAMRRRCFCTS